MKEKKKITAEELSSMISEQVEEKVKKVIGTVAVPDGYIKCKGCGHLIPIDMKDNCVYCEKENKPENDEEDEGGVGTILDILDDDDED